MEQQEAAGARDSPTPAYLSQEHRSAAQGSPALVGVPPLARADLLQLCQEKQGLDGGADRRLAAEERGRSHSRCQNGTKPSGGRASMGVKVTAGWVRKERRRPDSNR